jgi:hypothetical protein
MTYTVLVQRKINQKSDFNFIHTYQGHTFNWCDRPRHDDEIENTTTQDCHNYKILVKSSICNSVLP